MKEEDDIIPEAGQRVGWHGEDSAEDVIDKGTQPLGQQHKWPLSILMSTTFSRTPVIVA